jgi:hypothetical protein
MFDGLAIVGGMPVERVRCVRMRSGVGCNNGPTWRCPLSDGRQETQVGSYPPRSVLPPCPLSRRAMAAPTITDQGRVEEDDDHALPDTISVLSSWQQIYICRHAWLRRQRACRRRQRKGLLGGRDHSWPPGSAHSVVRYRPLCRVSDRVSIAPNSAVTPNRRSHDWQLAEPVIHGVVGLRLDRLAVRQVVATRPMQLDHCQAGRW